MYFYKRHGIYYVSFQDESTGKQRRVSTHSKTKPGALKFVSDLKEKSLASKKIKSITLGNFQREYVKLISQSQSKSYEKSITHSFNKFIIHFGANTPLHKITTKEIESFIASNFNTTKHGTALIYRTLKSAFNKAVGWGYIQENPFVKIKPPKIPRKNPVFIYEYELTKIIECEANKDLKDFYLLCFHTGMRLNEVINLQWNAVDLKEREITVKNTKTFTTKNKRERTIPINDTLYKMLVERLPKLFNLNVTDRYVFERVEGIKFNGLYVSKQFKKAVIKAGINNDVHLHTLRHSFCTNLLLNGADVKSIQELAGHSQISVTMNYTHVTKEQLRKTVNRLDHKTEGSIKQV